MEMPSGQRCGTGVCGKSALEKARKVAEQTRKMKPEELEKLSACTSLRDLQPGTVLFILSVTTHASQHGDYGIARFGTLAVDGSLRDGKLIMPERFLAEAGDDGGLPAVYVYYGKVAIKNEKSFHDLRRVPVDPAKPYGVGFTVVDHARELQKKTPAELRSQLFTRSLTEIAAGTTLILFDLKYVKTPKCRRTPTVAYELSVENWEVEEGMTETVGRIYLPPRFTAEFKPGQPRVARYTGMKKGKGGRTYHDLVFMPMALSEEEAVGGCADPSLVVAAMSVAPKRTSMNLMGKLPSAPKKHKEAAAETQLPPFDTQIVSLDTDDEDEDERMDADGKEDSDAAADIADETGSPLAQAASKTLRRLTVFKLSDISD